MTGLLYIDRRLFDRSFNFNGINNTKTIHNQTKYRSPIRKHDLPTQKGKVDITNANVRVTMVNELQKFEP